MPFATLETAMGWPVTLGWRRAYYAAKGGLTGQAASLPAWRALTIRRDRPLAPSWAPEAKVSSSQVLFKIFYDLRYCF
jgi:hypothetical protein